MKRLSIDLVLAAAIAALPWLTMSGRIEPVRLGLLAALVAAGALLRRARHAAQAAAGLTMLALGWLESFPAGNHSAEVGTYILCGTAVVALATFRAARRSQFLEA